MLPHLPWSAHDCVVHRPVMMHDLAITKNYTVFLDTSGVLNLTGVRPKVGWFSSVRSIGRTFYIRLAAHMPL